MHLQLHQLQPLMDMTSRARDMAEQRDMDNKAQRLADMDNKAQRLADMDNKAQQQVDMDKVQHQVVMDNKARHQAVTDNLVDMVQRRHLQHLQRPHKQRGGGLMLQVMGNKHKEDMGNNIRYKPDIFITQTKSI